MIESHESNAGPHLVDGLPPGPKLLRAAQTGWWASRPTSFMRRCQRRYGDIFTLRTHGFGDVVVLADPVLIKEVFTGDSDVFAAGEANAAMAPVLGDHSLLTLDGASHLRQRKLMLPPFHGEAIVRYRERIEKIAAAEVARWPLGEPFAIRPSMQAITFEVILGAVLGVRDTERRERLREVLPKVLEFSMFDMWIVLLFPKILDTKRARAHEAMRVRPEVDSLLYEEIAAHRAEPEGRDDILALLVSARDEDGVLLSDEELLDQMITLLLAGHETTTTALAWAFERLIRNPGALERLLRELEQGEETYLDAVVKETLRVRPVIDRVWRRLKAPAVIGGYRLPAGTLIVLAISLVQTSDAFADAEDFRPERFLEDGPPPYTFIPFGGGPRRCIGASFAVMEMKTVLRSVFERVELRPVDPRPEKPRGHHVTQVPGKGAQVVAHAR
jgi:cytochrome P450 family 135